MEGADESTELWRHPCLLIKFKRVSEKWQNDYKSKSSRKSKLPVRRERIMMTATTKISHTETPSISRIWSSVAENRKDLFFNLLDQNVWQHSCKLAPEFTPKNNNYIRKNKVWQAKLVSARFSVRWAMLIEAFLLKIQSPGITERWILFRYRYKT